MATIIEAALKLAAELILNITTENHQPFCLSICHTCVEESVERCRMLNVLCLVLPDTLDSHLNYDSSKGLVVTGKIYFDAHEVNPLSS